MIETLHLHEGEQIESVADLNRIAARDLAENQFWCIIDPDGRPLDLTASKQMTAPIVTFCEHVGCDWDDASDDGFSLEIVTLAASKGETG